MLNSLRLNNTGLKLRCETLEALRTELQFDELQCVLL